MTTIRVAACQMSSTDDPSENLTAIREATARASARGARIVVFPEAAMACFGTRLDEVAEPLDGPFADGVRAVAQEHDVTLVVGMVIRGLDEGRVPHWSFMIVAGVALAVFLIGWRAIRAGLTRRGHRGDSR